MANFDPSHLCAILPKFKYQYLAPHISHISVGHI
eukprot:SAG31_NODE_36110_length_316_cov_0.953917_1_plen_33_part_10